MANTWVQNGLKNIKKIINRRKVYFRPSMWKREHLVKEIDSLLDEKDILNAKHYIYHTLDIQRWEVGAKRPLNGTSKVKK